MTHYRPKLGALVTSSGVSFRVWAPAQERVGLVLNGHDEIAMQKEPGGYFTAHVGDARAGQRYQYRLKEGLRADPVSRFQPDGPLGPSMIVDPGRFAWTDDRWRGIPERHRHVLYEMHIGTFTPEGTWSAAERHLEFLRDVGITTLEIMPIAEFSGDFGWGYDGVNLFAPTRLYGGPDDARHFIDRAHALGLAVVLDVVYNHFGPVGNFIAQFSDTFLAEPGEWGDSINFDGPGSEGVRAFVIENAAYWVAEYHFDGLRLDATHAMRDRSPEHIVAELARAARRAAGARSVLITAESEPQETALLKEGGKYSDGVDAIWNEDWHHAAFVALTGRRAAYFTDYRGNANEFAVMARHGTLYQGQWYTWQKHGRGGFALGLPGASFVSFLENHDQVANTGPGWRLFQHVNHAKWRALTAMLLLGPGIPMLFQGQEFASTRPFAYFAHHQADLAAAVRQGRAEFLAQFPALSSAAMRDLIPDPSSRQTFEAATLRIDADRERHPWSVRLHTDLLRLRRDDPVLARLGTTDVRVESSAPTDDILLQRYIAADNDRLLVVNLGDDHVCSMNDPLYASRPGMGWTRVWSSEHPDYGGGGMAPFEEGAQWLLTGGSAMLLASELRSASARPSRRNASR
jgi:maltooligosyltrehalose trehalohydrolase